MANTSEIQSVLFSRKLYNVKTSMSWMKQHRIPMKKLDITENYIRYRQKSPKKYKRFRMKQISKGVLFVLGWKK